MYRNTSVLVVMAKDSEIDSIVEETQNDVINLVVASATDTTLSRPCIETKTKRSGHKRKLSACLEVSVKV